jgi:hypothetical protein
MNTSRSVKRSRRAMRVIGSAFIVAPLAIAASARGAAPNAAASQCNFYNYHHDESRNAGGSGHCSSDCDCDGMRSCGPNSSCEGDARPALPSCNDARYHWNEAWNPRGPSRCQGDCECDGLRTCVSGACQGKAR